jgi:hypothetical protein
VLDFKLDFSDFNKKFKGVTEKIIPECAEVGMGRAALQLMNDAIMTVPTVPLREGWLRGSGSAFVNNKLIGLSSEKHGKAGKANTVSVESMNSDDIVGMVGFNTPYAARIHEGIGFKFREPSSGPKYLESKLMSNGETYFKIIAQAIKDKAQLGLGLSQIGG